MRDVVEQLQRLEMGDPSRTPCAGPVRNRLVERRLPPPIDEAEIRHHREPGHRDLEADPFRQGRPDWRRARARPPIITWRVRWARHPIFFPSQPKLRPGVSFWMEGGIAARSPSPVRAMTRSRMTAPSGNRTAGPSRT